MTFSREIVKKAVPLPHLQACRCPRVGLAASRCPHSRRHPSPPFTPPPTPPGVGTGRVVGCRLGFVHPVRPSAGRSQLAPTSPHHRHSDWWWRARGGRERSQGAAATRVAHDHSPPWGLIRVPANPRTKLGHRTARRGVRGGLARNTAAWHAQCSLGEDQPVNPPLPTTTPTR